MFSSIKMEEYMESGLSGIFRVKTVTKNIVRGSPGTHFLHTKVKLAIFSKKGRTLIGPVFLKVLTPKDVLI